MVHVLHASPAVHAFRWWYALRHSAVRLVAFTAILLGLASVSPFSWDYPTLALLSHGKTVESGLAASLVSVNSTADFAIWAGGTLLPGSGSLAADGRFINSVPGFRRGADGKLVGDDLDSSRVARLSKAASLAALINAGATGRSRATGTEAFTDPFFNASAASGGATSEAEAAVLSGDEDVLGDALLRSGITALVQDGPAAPRAPGSPRRASTTIFGLTIVGSALRVVKQRVIAWPAQKPRAAERVLVRQACSTPEALREALQACLPATPPDGWAWTVNGSGRPAAGDTIAWTNAGAANAGAAAEVAPGPVAFLAAPYDSAWQAGRWPSGPQRAGSNTSWWDPSWPSANLSAADAGAVPASVLPDPQREQWMLQEQRILRGNASEMAAQMLAWLRGDVLINASTGKPASWGPLLEPGTTTVTVEGTLYNGTAGIFVGMRAQTQLLVGLAPSGLSLAPGTAIATSFGVALPLFTSRFPPSVTFEVVVGLVSALLVLSSCLRAIRQCRTGQTGSPLENSDHWRLDKIANTGGGGAGADQSGESQGGRLQLRSATAPAHGGTGGPESAAADGAGDGAGAADGKGKEIAARGGARARRTSARSAPETAEERAALAREKAEAAADSADTSTSSSGSSVTGWLRAAGTVLSSHAYDVVLAATLLWVLGDEVTLRGWADGIEATILDGQQGGFASGATLVPPDATLMPGSESFGYVDLLSGFLPRWYRLLGALAFAVLFGSVRVVSDVVILPEVGPMLWAVFSTATHPTVLLYLLLLLATVSIFGVAFHTVIGYESADFATVVQSMLTLFQLSLGGVETMRVSGQALAITLFVFVAVIFLLIVNLFIAVTTSVLPAVRASSGVFWNAFISSMLEARLASDASLLAGRRADVSPLAEASALGIRAVTLPLRVVRPMWARAASAVAVVAARVGRDAEAAVAKAAAAARMLLAGHKMWLTRGRAEMTARRAPHRGADGAAAAAAARTADGAQSGCCGCCGRASAPRARGMSSVVPQPASDSVPLVPAGTADSAEGGGALPALNEGSSSAEGPTSDSSSSSESDADGPAPGPGPRGRFGSKKAMRSRDQSRDAAGGMPARRRSWVLPPASVPLPWLGAGALEPWRAAEFSVVRASAMVGGGGGASAASAPHTSRRGGHVWLDSTTAALVAGGSAPARPIRADEVFAPVVTPATLRDASMIAGAATAVGSGTADTPAGKNGSGGRGAGAAAGLMGESRPAWLCEVLWLSACCCCIAVCDVGARSRTLRGKPATSGCCLCCAWGPDVDRRRFERVRQGSRGGRRGLRRCIRGVCRDAARLVGCLFSRVCCGVCARFCCVGGRERDGAHASVEARWAVATAAAERHPLGADYRGVVNDADDDGGYGSEDSEAMAELMVGAGRAAPQADAAAASASRSGTGRSGTESAGRAAAMEVLRWSGMSMADVDTVAGLATARFVTPESRAMFEHGSDDDED